MFSVIALGSQNECIRPEAIDRQQKSRQVTLHTRGQPQIELVNGYLAERKMKNSLEGILNID